MYVWRLLSDMKSSTKRERLVIDNADISDLIIIRFIHYRRGLLHWTRKSMVVIRLWRNVCVPCITPNDDMAGSLLGLLLTNDFLEGNLEWAQKAATIRKFISKS